MAATNKSNATRRSILQAGAVAVGAALLPHPAVASSSPATSMDAIRADYQRRIERLAESLKPRFVSGELHGWREDDGEGWTERDPSTRPPTVRLEYEIRDAWFPRDDDYAPAYLVLACSPSESRLEGNIPIADVRGAAAECAARDVIRLARERGWYVPTEDEDLGIEAQA